MFTKDFYVSSGAVWIRVNFNEQFHPVNAQGFHRNKCHTEAVEADRAIFHHDTHKGAYSCHFPHMGNYKFEMYWNGREWMSLN
jgi:hypothetical protein